MDPLTFLIPRELQMFHRKLASKNKCELRYAHLTLDMLVFQTWRTLSIGLSPTRTACLIKLLYTDQLLVWSLLIACTEYTDCKWHCGSLATRCNTQYGALQIIPQIELCLMINLNKVPSWSTSSVRIVCLGGGLQQYARNSPFITRWLSGNVPG